MGVEYEEGKRMERTGPAQRGRTPSLLAFP
jgi:hypothetical protein